MRIVVTGRKGQVATALMALNGKQAEVFCIGRPDLDLTIPESVLPVLEKIKPDVIVNAAAFTAVDLAETEHNMAFAVNEKGAAAVARAAQMLHVPVIQLSTDYVFDGAKSGPYCEDDIALPVSIYGKSKLAGEKAVMAATANHVILRTAWIYAASGKNFVRTMLRLAEERDEIGVVADQWGCPTYAADIAQALINIARNLIDDPNDAKLRGVFHLTGQGETTWAQFAKEIFALSRTFNGKVANVVSITTQEYPTAARRPMNSRLSVTKLAERHNVLLPDWRQSLSRCVEQIYSAS